MTNLRTHLLHLYYGTSIYARTPTHKHITAHLRCTVTSMYYVVRTSRAVRECSSTAMRGFWLELEVVSVLVSCLETTTQNGLLVTFWCYSFSIPSAPCGASRWFLCYSCFEHYGSGCLLYAILSLRQATLYKVRARSHGPCC